MSAPFRKFQQPRIWEAQTPPPTTEGAQPGRLSAFDADDIHRWTQDEGAKVTWTSSDAKINQHPFQEPARRNLPQPW
jgi:hypothetical protein